MLYLFDHWNLNQEEWEPVIAAVTGAKLLLRLDSFSAWTAVLDQGLDGITFFTRAGRPLSPAVEPYLGTGPGKIQRYYLQNAEPTPYEIAQLIDALAPAREVPPDWLERAFYGLVDEIDSAQDAELVKRIGARLWEVQKRDNSNSWLALAKQAYTFSTVLVYDETVGEKLPLYLSMGYDRWSAFAKDFLGIPPSSASAMKKVWEVFRIQLGWDEPTLRAHDKSKLLLLAPRLEQLLESDEAGAQDLLAALETDSYSVLMDKLQADKGDGYVVRFRYEPVQDYAQLREWATGTLLPELVSLQGWVNQQPFDNAVVLVFRPDLDPENLNALKRKLEKSIRWNARAEDAPEEEVQVDPIPV